MNAEQARRADTTLAGAGKPRFAFLFLAKAWRADTILGAGWSCTGLSGLWFSDGMVSGGYHHRQGLCRHSVPEVKLARTADTENAEPRTRWG